MSAGPKRGQRTRALLDGLVAVLAGVLALGVYIRSLAPGLLWGDSAEFQMAAWLGGFAHPTGYPLYLMLGWLWTHLVPLRDPAFRMNLFSALCGGVAVALLSLVVMRLLRFLAAASRVPLGHPERSSPSVWAAESKDAFSERITVPTSRLIALGAALAFTFTPTFWSQAVIAEVYTLHAAFVAGLMLALLSWAGRCLSGDFLGARRSSYLVALLFGLSLTHHRSTILLIPATALFVIIVLASTGRRPRFSVRHAGLLAFCLLAPLLLYLYIPVRAPYVSYDRLPLGPNQSLQLYDSTLAGFLAHVSGSVFSASLVALRLGDLDLLRLVTRFVDELSANGLLLGALGLIALLVLAVRDRNRRSWAVLALTGGFFVTQVAFNLLYAIGDIYVFYIPAYLVWVLWMASGAWAIVLLAAWLFTGAGERARRWAVTAAGVLAFIVLVAFAYRSAVVFWPRVQAATDDSARTAWEALLKSDLPQDAVLISNDRDEMVPLWYLTYVEGLRSDLTGLFPLDPARLSLVRRRSGHRPGTANRPACRPRQAHAGARSQVRPGHYARRAGGPAGSTGARLCRPRPNSQLIPPTSNMPERFACSATTSIQSRFDRVSRPG